MSDSNLRALWLSVIYQAIQDLVIARYQYGLEAEIWIFRPNKDFKIVCDLAGVHPDKIRKAARAAKDNPMYKLELFSPPKKKLYKTIL